LIFCVTELNKFNVHVILSHKYKIPQDLSSPVLYLNKRRRMPGCITSKIINLFLKLLLLILVFIESARYWAQDFYTQQAIPHTLSPSPQIAILDYESSLCLKLNTPIKPPLHNHIRCPHEPIVTVQQLERLGNQVYEYISVWAVAKKTGREPCVPSCMIRELENSEGFQFFLCHTLHTVL
jgi:hypothetical protein